MKSSDKLKHLNLRKHIEKLCACDLCPKMFKPVVTGNPVFSKVILVGQAPGVKEPILKRPFAWTAGKMLFQWFENSCGLNEEQFRKNIYMAAVCRCYPGKKKKGGDRVPDTEEIANCANWLKSEFSILKPELVIPVGKLAITQFMECSKLADIIGHSFNTLYNNNKIDIIPLPHPSGASPWPRIEPGKSLLQKALSEISNHAAMKRITAKL